MEFHPGAPPVRGQRAHARSARSAPLSSGALDGPAGSTRARAVGAPSSGLTRTGETVQAERGRSPAVGHKADASTGGATPRRTSLVHEGGRTAKTIAVDLTLLTGFDGEDPFIEALLDRYRARNRPAPGRPTGSRRMAA